MVKYKYSMSESPNVVSAPVEQEVPQTPSIEDLMKQLEEQKRIAKEATAKLQEQAVKLNAIEKQREKMPIKLYKIHRKIHYEFVNTIEARTVEEAKQIANSTSLNDMFKNWKKVNRSSTSFKKKTDPVINPKTGEPFRKQKEEDNKDTKVQSKKITKSKVNKGKKKNAKKK